MQNRYKIEDQLGVYFITFTVVGWMDLFTRSCYNDCIIDALKYCHLKKGLQIHAFVIMTSHLHLIVSSLNGFRLPDAIRDFKKFTAKELIKLINEMNESRREWILKKFAHEASRTKRGSNYILWQEGYHAKQIVSNTFLEQKLFYIHQNPVESGFVSRAEDWGCGITNANIDYTRITNVVEWELCFGHVWSIFVRVVNANGGPIKI